MHLIQPWDLTAAYKTQFRARRRQHSEDIYAYMEPLHKLADMDWPLLDPLAREVMVTDQFLTGLDSQELRVQAATTSARRIEDLMRIAGSGGQRDKSRHQARIHSGQVADESEGYESDPIRIVDQIVDQTQRVHSSERTVTPPIPQGPFYRRETREALSEQEGLFTIYGQKSIT